MTGSNGMYIVYITYHHNIDVVKVIGCEVCKNVHSKNIDFRPDLYAARVDDHIASESKKASETLSESSKRARVEMYLRILYRV